MTGQTVSERVRAAYARSGEVDRPEIWILLRPLEDVLEDAVAIDRRMAAGEAVPLAGTLFAVKDNIDVAGLPTTAGCPAYAYPAKDDAPAVRRLLDAGSVLLGKTNLDQFATGLVGTRSPYGAVRGSRDPERISGGSSSGSAVAVALGIADLSLGTDTAGSGRVPAAFGGIVGIKPTRGLVPNTGVVPACRTLDCVSIFARELDLARSAMSVITGPDDDDPLSRAWPAGRPLAAPSVARVAVPLPSQLGTMSQAWQRAFAEAVARLVALGTDVVEIDIAPLLAAGSLLYDGSFVAERYAAVGRFIDEHPGEVDPTVATIVSPAKAIPAHQLVADTERLDRAKSRAAALLEGACALMLPTVPEHPRIAEVAADPIGVNARLGVYTTFCNLLDWCAVAVPAGEIPGEAEAPEFFGVSFLAPAFHDAVVADIAERFLRAAEPEVSAEPASEPVDGVGLVVVGAHLSGLSLNHQLTGARLLGPVRTAPVYRMFALDTVPPKPGLLRVDHGGVSVAGELWDVPPLTLATLLAGLPAPMSLGPVQLEDGSLRVGFHCEAIATVGAKDISDFASWPAYLGSET